MGQADAAASELAVLAFEDGFGRRYRVQARGERDVHLELLCLRPELADIPSFESALRERASHLSTFHHDHYARVRRVDRVTGGALMIFSECRPGVRLAELLAATERRGLALDINAALCLLRQLAPAVAELHESAHVANGVLGPERIILTPHAQLVMIEHAVGGALEHLHYSRERYWQDLRVALPPSADSNFGECADVAQLGMVGLALVLGRPVRGDEYPGSIDDLVEAACARSENGDQRPLSADLRSWLRRALQLDIRRAFKSATDARVTLEELLARDDNTYSADSGALTTFLAKYHGSTEPALHGPESMVPHVVSPGPASAGHRPSLVQKPVAPYEVSPSSDVTRSEATAEAQVRPTTSSHGRVGSLRIITDTEEPPIVPTAKTPSIARSWVAAGVAGVALFVVGTALIGSRAFMSSATAASNGTLVVDTNPSGAQIVVDDVPRGQTPLNLLLQPGSHMLIVRGEGEPRTVPVTIVAGATSSHYLDLPKAAVTTGTLQVRTDPSGARVSVDGQAKGKTPLTLTDLESGEHSVTLENDLGSVTQTVVVAPGEPATLVVPLGGPQGAVASGWLSVSAPIELRISEQGRLLGTSTIDRIMLPAGAHEIEIASESLGFRMTRTVQVSPGKVSPVPVVLPKGVVSLNAVPWATVSIDGASVGETPIGNLAVPIGPHEVVFTNPQFGERRQAINVTLKAPVRTSIDLSQK